MTRLIDSAVTGRTTALHAGFLRSAEGRAESPAVRVAGRTVTYGELREVAASLAATIQRQPDEVPRLTAVFAHRSTTAYAGILGALMAGHGYVPLSRLLPVDRTNWMLRSAGCRSLIVDAESAAQLDAVLEGVDWPMVVIVPDGDDVEAMQARWPRHTFAGSRDLAPSTSWGEPDVDAAGVAYLLFTSGSTGRPKGVMVSHANVTHFVASMSEKLDVSHADRFSQLFDTTFDLSVFDMFVAWANGACVCCPPEKSLLNPDKFVRDEQLTVWCSVPSTGVLMKRFGVLTPGRYPGVRYALFCGEPLPADVAESWALAAPSATVENLYGPTELTVACSSYQWDRDRGRAECADGMVPIGWPLPGMCAVIVDETLQEVAPGEIGELLMSGPQVSAGYWNNDDATRDAYVKRDGTGSVFYRTGDRVRRPAGNGPMEYVGRVDGQIKVLGHRVELGEIEARLREEAGVEQAVALGWPKTATGAGGVVAFVTGKDLDGGALRKRLDARLPAYAVPRLVHVVPELPLTANGKVDRQALQNGLAS
jgi:amino acid adenylation domain-containing protein